jgi:peptide/nickel transport system substrate-binding protein
MNSVVTSHPFAKQVQRYMLLTTLVRYDSTLTIEPYLAKRWTWSRDSSELTFTLNDAVHWHDGQPTTARDAAFTLQVARDSTAGYPRRVDLADLVDVTATDDTTLALRFARRQRRVPDVLSDLAILPRHLLQSNPPSRMREAAWNERPVGNGPYRFVRHEGNRRWVFEANSRFPAALGGPPALDRVVIAVVDEPMTKLAALVSSELDFAGIQPAHAEFVRRDTRLAVVDYPLFFSYAIVFNTRRAPFSRLENRRAIALAIDRLAIVSGYLFGFGVPAAGPLPPELELSLESGVGGNARDGPVTPPLPMYAPGRARAMIDDSLRFELVTVGSGEAALEQLLQQQLARIGVTMTIRQLELATFLERVNGAHDFDAAVMGISGDLQLGYLRSLLELTGLPATGEGRALLPIFAQSTPATFLYHARGVQGMNRRVTGVRMDLRGELASLSGWRAR